MEFFPAIKSCFAKYVKFGGRASRSEYWQFIVFSYVVGGVAALLDQGLGTTFMAGDQQLAYGYFNTAWGLFVLLPSISVLVRRLHDLGRVGWWFWLLLIPLVGAIIMLVWSCRRGTFGDNRFGPDPLERAEPPAAGAASPMSLVVAVKTGFAKYVTFSGRASRAAFWYFTLLYSIGLAIAYFLYLATYDLTAPPPHRSGLWFVPAIWLTVFALPLISVQVRRLHDIGRSAWWLWIGLIPAIGLILVLVWNCTRGNAGPNEYGSDPRGQAGPQAPAAGEPDPLTQG